ncbi:MAG: hypothetical protein K0R48_950, partial [Gammaproteobacteria bacterium]|nr:hypothetical protein [Gammaproteobacteria bacterium]
MPANNHELKNVQTDQRLKSNPGVESTPKLAHSPDNQNTLQRARSQSTGVVSSSAANPEEQLTPHQRFNIEFKDDLQVINIMKTLVTYAQSRKKTNVLNAKLTNLLEARDRQKQNPEDPNLIFSVLEAMEDIFVLHVSLRSETDSKKMREDIDFIKNQVSRVLKMYGYDKLRFS